MLKIRAIELFDLAFMGVAITNKTIAQLHTRNLLRRKFCLVAALLNLQFCKAVCYKS